MARCYICNYCDSFKPEDGSKRSIEVQPDGAELCSLCLSQITEDIDETRALEPGEVDYRPQTLRECITELERRIPALFIGEDCPLDQVHTGCHCTYATGCKALKNKATLVKFK